MSNEIHVIELEKILKKTEEALISVEALNADGEKVLDMAERYVSDAKHFIIQGDLRTAFGSVEYAHGLLDGAVGAGSLKNTKPENKELFVFENRPE
ncbi:MAG: DUF357 domain-containing protein [archaeon]